jgi:hypothetical protein
MFKFVLSKYFSIYGTITTVFITEIFVAAAMILATLRIRNSLKVSMI